MRNPTTFTEDFKDKLINIGKSFKIDLKMRGVGSLYSELMEKLHLNYETKPVVIIDEYDMPIKRHFNNIATARLMMEELKDFYLGVKDTENVHLLFLTGISTYLFFIRFCFLIQIFCLNFFLLKIMLQLLVKLSFF